MADVWSRNATLALGVTLALGLWIAPALEAAAQQPGQRGNRGGGGGGGGGGARPAVAPMARPAPAPMMRPAPMPQMRQAPMARPMPQMNAPRMSAPQQARPMPQRRFDGPRMGGPRMDGQRMDGPRMGRIPNAAPMPAARMEQRQQRTQQRQERIQQRQQAIQNRPPTQATPGGAGSSSADQRALRRQERQTMQQQRQLQTVEQRLNRLQQRQTSGNFNPRQQRELQRLQRAQQRLAPVQARPAVTPGAGQAARDGRGPRITRDQARAGRFATPFYAGAIGDRGGPRFERRALRIAARAAWRQNAFARYVPWAGALYWPYAYSDVFLYPLWPVSYEPGYWAYAYDDLFDGVFFPDGAPYIADAEPYDGPYARSTTGSAPRQQPVPGRITQATRQLCAEPARGLTAWPVEQIAEAVRPTAEQKTLLDDIQKASVAAAERFKSACPEDLPMTPPGRLEAMIVRLNATLDAVQLVRPPLGAFTESLNDEQRARFNEIGPKLGNDTRKPAAAPAEGSDCGGEKTGLSALAIDRIEQAVKPREGQTALIEQLDQAMNRAIDTLQKTCPTTIALTPVGRLETMEQRLRAMIAAADMVKPALEAFYGGLSSEQKAAFNRLGRQTAQAE